MKANIYYFSGTKNTQVVAEKFGAALASLGYTSKIQSIEDCTTPETGHLLVIGGPLYAGNMPEKLIRWVRKNIPESRGGKAIVFSTSAALLNPYGVVSIGKKLIEKGYDLMAMLPYEMPRNFYFGAYVPTESSMAQKQLLAVDGKLESNLIAALEGEPLSIDQQVFTYDQMAKVMSLLARFMGKNFNVTKACIQCGKCVSSCPTSNIIMKEKPRFQFHCMMCTRCIHTCPVHAITYKHHHYAQYKIPLKE